jgi:hypothetical protein
MDPRLRWRAIRVAVKDRSTNEETVQILAEALAAAEPRSTPSVMPAM